MILVHVTGDRSTEGHDRIRFRFQVLLGLHGSGPGEPTDEPDRLDLAHSEPIEISEVDPEGSRMLLPVDLSGFVDLGSLLEQGAVPHQVDPSVGRALEVRVGDRQAAPRIPLDVLGVTRHPAEDEDRTTVVVDGEPHDAPAGKSRVRLAVGAHDREPVVVLDEGSDVRGEPDLRDVRLVIDEGLDPLPLLRSQIVDRRPLLSPFVAAADVVPGGRGLLLVEPGAATATASDGSGTKDPRRRRRRRGQEEEHRSEEDHRHRRRRLRC
mmetsp:Transcript_211/g.537  ORF Transcript_211/g.537 Transcript_211/m.537 type:complete len:266 (+) Transcript_211:504-1301(+)